MFYNAHAFNQPLDAWDVSHVAEMGYMFRSASAFDQPLNGWNVSRVTSMQYMFYNTSDQTYCLPCLPMSGHSQ